MPEDGSFSNPYDTLYDLPSLEEESRIGVERGSILRSFLDQRVPRLTLAAYGDGDPPILDLRDRLADADWTPTSEFSNVYQQVQEAPNTMSGAYTPRLWEDGEELPKQSSLADVASAPGSFSVATDSDSWTLYYRPSAGLPSNHQVHWAARSTAYVGSVGGVEGGMCEGLHIRHPLANAGCIQMGPGGIVRRCLLVDGSKHNLVHAGGRAEDVVCIGSAPNTVRSPLDQSAIAWFQDSNVTERQAIVERNVITVRTNGLAVLGHSDGVGFNQADVKGRVIIDTPFGGYWPNGATIEGLYTRQSGTIPRAGVIRYAQLDGKPGQTNGGANSGLVIENSVVFHQALTRSLRPGSSVTLRHCTLFSSERPIISNVGASSYDLTLDHCVIIDLGGGIADSGISELLGDHCVFFHPFLDRELSLSGSTTLSDLQASSRAFANSAWLSLQQYRQFFRGRTQGWLRGDVRIDPGARVTAADGSVWEGSLPDGTALSSIGPQRRWDWSSRSPEDGAPTQWPTPPESESEGQQYIADPDAWWDWNQTPPTYLNHIDQVLAAAYGMDQETGGEPDLAGTHDTVVASGAPGSTSSPFGSARTFDGESALQTDRIVPDAESGFFISFPVLFSSLNRQARLVSSRKAGSGYHLQAFPDGHISLYVSYRFSQRNVQVSTPENTLEPDVWYLVQSWVDTTRGEAGIRVDDTEFASSLDLLATLHNNASTVKFGAAQNNTRKLRGAIGRTFIWDIGPSKEDRDWVFNQGTYRTLAEVQGYTATVFNL